jgi:hypothetical protein
MITKNELVAALRRFVVPDLAGKLVVQHGDEFPHGFSEFAEFCSPRF